jgi:hypothetical protein
LYALGGRGRPTAFLGNRLQPPHRSLKILAATLNLGDRGNAMSAQPPDRAGIDPRPAQATADTSVTRESVRTAPTAAGPPTPAGVIVPTGPCKLGRFKLVELLGQGAFGQVFRARDPQLDRDVAIKMPRVGVITGDANRERRSAYIPMPFSLVRQNALRGLPDGCEAQILHEYAKPDSP